MDYDEWSDSGESNSDSELIPEAAPPPVRKWDLFRETPPPLDTGSAVKSKIWKRLEKLSKVFAYIISFMVVLGCAVVSKGTMVFMFKQIAREPTNIPFCNPKTGSQHISGNDSQSDLEVEFSCSGSSNVEACSKDRVVERVAWIWAIAFVFLFPQIGAFLRSFRKCLFKFNNLPTFKNFLFVLVMEVCHTLGLAILCYMVLPDMDSIRVFLLSSSLALIPACFLLLSRFQEDNERKTHISKVRLAIDIVAIVAQLSGAIFWPLLQWMGVNQDQANPHPYPWAVPLGVILTSFGWWETFTEEDSWTGLGKQLWKVKKDMIEKTGSRYIVYAIVIPFKILIFLGSMVIITWKTGMIDKPSNLADYFEQSFGNHTYKVTTIHSNTIGVDDGTAQRTIYTLYDSTNHAAWVLLIQISTTYFAYVGAKFASKVQIQIFSFAFPLTCVLPFGLAILVSMCGAQAEDMCAYQSGSIRVPNRLFFECPNVGDYFQYAVSSNAWIALVWYISFVWINIHIWYPKSPRLATSEQIFGTPWYDGLFIDVSLIMNRRRDGVEEIAVEEIEDEDNNDHLRSEYLNFPGNAESKGSKSTVKGSDRVTK